MASWVILTAARSFIGVLVMATVKEISGDLILAAEREPFGMMKMKRVITSTLLKTPLVREQRQIKKTPIQTRLNPATIILRLQILRQINLPAQHLNLTAHNRRQPRHQVNLQATIVLKLHNHLQIPNRLLILTKISQLRSLHVIKQQLNKRFLQEPTENVSGKVSWDTNQVVVNFIDAKAVEREALHVTNFRVLTEHCGMMMSFCAIILIK